LILVAGGTPLLFDLLKRAARREFGSDLLAGLSITAAAVLGEYLAGSIVVVMLSGGITLEHYATRRASAILGALAKRMPRNAHRVSETGIGEIDLEQVNIGDHFFVFPHEICPVDGTVVEGRSTMDESYLTGGHS
jgi:cation transport ATPase